MPFIPIDSYQIMQNLLHCFAGILYTYFLFWNECLLQKGLCVSFDIKTPLTQNTISLIILCALLMLNLISSYFFLFTRSPSDSIIVFAFAPFSLINIIALVCYQMSVLTDRRSIALDDISRRQHYARTCKIIGIVYLIMLSLYFIVVGPLFLMVTGLFVLGSFLGFLHPFSDSLYFLCGIITIGSIIAILAISNNNLERTNNKKNIRKDEKNEQSS
jgi:hypothetical protein